MSEGFTEWAEKENRFYRPDKSPFKKPILRRCPQCGAEFLERRKDDRCPRCEGKATRVLF